MAAPALNHRHDDQPQCRSPGHGPAASGGAPQGHDQKSVVRQRGEMHRRRNCQVNALRCQHQRGKAGQQVDDAADDHNVVPVQHRQCGFAAPPAAYKAAAVRLIHEKSGEKKYMPAMTRVNTTPSPQAATMSSVDSRGALARRLASTLSRVLPSMTTILNFHSCHCSPPAVAPAAGRGLPR